MPAKQVSNTNQGSTAVNSAVYEEILVMALLLRDGERTAGPYRLFGTVTKIDTVWSSQYQNITVTIQIGDRANLPILCYRLTGEGAQNLKVGDQITVEGTLSNYKGTIQFDKGCKLVGYGEVLK